MKKIEEPMYQHDCNSCTFLGTYQNHDLYVCGDTIPTVIARDGNEPQENSSGLDFAKPGTVLGEALKRACEQGHIDPVYYERSFIQAMIRQNRESHALLLKYMGISTVLDEDEKMDFYRLHTLLYNKLDAVEDELNNKLYSNQIKL